MTNLPIELSLCYQCINFEVSVIDRDNQERSIPNCKVKSKEWIKNNDFPIPLQDNTDNCDDFIGSCEPVYSLHGDLEGHYEKDFEYYWIDIYHLDYYNHGQHG